LAFRYFGGRTGEIVYDQDRATTVAENAGDLIFTESFEAYRKHAGFSIFLCHGYDPQSKGKIESMVKYVKRNFLARRIYGADFNAQQRRPFVVGEDGKREDSRNHKDDPQRSFRGGNQTFIVNQL